MEYWIVYDVVTGEPLFRGQGSPAAVAAQRPHPGTEMLVVPFAVIAKPELDLAALRTSLMAGIDAQAEAVRQSILTPGSGQAMTYARKEAEARAYAADESAATPFLSVEARARGMTIAGLAAEVIALADAWVRVGAAIEGLRMGAKTRIAAAATFSEIVAVANIDWVALPA